MFLASLMFLAFVTIAAMWVHIFNSEKETLAQKGERPFERWEKERAFVHQKDLRNCSACSKWIRESFPVQTEYFELDLLIEREAFRHLKAIPGGISDSKHKFMGIGIGGRIFAGAEIYACTGCGQEWELSVPDMADRGYFKPIKRDEAD
jgi:hypothetical protein